MLPRIVHSDDDREQPQLDITHAETEKRAEIIVIRDGLSCFNKTYNEELTTEMLCFDWDTKFFHVNKQKVLNKLARHNINFSDKHQEPNFDQGESTIIAWDEVPILKEVRTNIHDAFNQNNLQCEGNLYYQKGKSGIGYHGDTERRKVVGLRLGGTMKLHYEWYFNNKPRGKNIGITLNSGDIYAMSEKAVGTDWKSAPLHKYTLRHAAGGPDYTTDTNRVKIYDEVTEGNVTIGKICFKDSKKGWVKIDDYQVF